MGIYKAPSAKSPFSLPADIGDEQVGEIQTELERLTRSAQYGWGHTIDFGRFKKEGFLGEQYLEIAGALDTWAWWPDDLTGQAVADIGCFTGGLSLYLMKRNPSTLYAVDELDDHLSQCSYLARVFEQDRISTIKSSLYSLNEHIEEASLDLVVLSGVLYHLSDMLVGLYTVRQLLKPGGILIIETNAVDDFKHSYANFGRFVAGMWWQPSGLCIEDMCEFMGFENIDIRFYKEGRCLVRASRSDRDIPFKRGMNWKFSSLVDAQHRTMDSKVMAPVNPRGWMHDLINRIKRKASNALKLRE